MDKTLAVEVTRIGTNWHARLIAGDTVVDEMACKLRSDIGWISREMLRWQHKCGAYRDYDWDFCAFARGRQQSEPNGKVWNCFKRSINE